MCTPKEILLVAGCTPEQELPKGTSGNLFKSQAVNRGKLAGQVLHGLSFTTFAALLTATSFSQPVNAHGLIESPASREQYCGVLTKPHEASDSDALYPVCAEAFEDYPSTGYNYMSVLTHTRGRIRPLPDLESYETAPDNEKDGEPDLPENVCGYNAETFSNGPTPWDEAIDWPTSTMSAGRNEIVWDIQWGPHFDDTEEFSYWITTEDFEFEVGTALTWDDFEEQPFCQLEFDRSDYDGNEDIIADTANAKFYTYCDVPERSGRHVIYGEWGRNYFTWERFHGCIDVEFSETSVTTVQASISASPSGDITGSGMIELTAADSTGDDLSYQWSINSKTTDAEYSFSDDDAETTTLSFTDPSAAGEVSIYLTVTSDDQADTQVLTLTHLTESTSSEWTYKQVLTQEQSLNEGDTVQMRVVLDDGTDVYLPEEALEITDETTDADQWPLALGTAVNELDSYIAIGVLDTDTDTVEPVESATANNVYTETDSSVASVFLNIVTDGSEETDDSSEETDDSSEEEDDTTDDEVITIGSINHLGLGLLLMVLMGRIRRQPK